MADLSTGFVWSFRYRFWPNNKSRMYLLESTGEFVKTHCLKEGDVLQIFRDCKAGTHVICAKKMARPPAALRSSGSCVVKVEESDSLSGVSSVSEDPPALQEDSPRDSQPEDSSSNNSKNRNNNNSNNRIENGCSGIQDGLESFPSLELGDEFIEEMMSLVDSADEPGSPESCSAR